MIADESPPEKSRPCDGDQDGRQNGETQYLTPSQLFRMKTRCMGRIQRKIDRVHEQIYRLQEQIWVLKGDKVSLDYCRTSYDYPNDRQTVFRILARLR